MNEVTNAERSVLAAVMDTNGRILDDLTLRGDDFLDKRLGDLFDLAVRRNGSGQPVDVVSMGDAQKTVPVADLFEIAELAPFRYAAPQHAEMVARHGMKRRLKSVADALHAVDAAMGVDEQLELARSLIEGTAAEDAGGIRWVEDYLPALEESWNNPDRRFTPSPWPSLNELIDGFRPGALYVVGARPGVGKSVIANQIALALAKAGAVSLSNLEMSGAEVVGRIISAEASIEAHAISTGRLSPEHRERLHNARQALSARIAVDDRASVGPGHIRQAARRVARSGKLAGIVVDYLQLMTGPKGMNRYEAVSWFSREMKLMAKDLDVPVIVLSQLNRQAAAGQPPRLSDLRESGAIEQDADCVILLNRETEGDRPTGEIVLDVAKNRHGKTGVRSLAWQGHFSRAVEMGRGC